MLVVETLHHVSLAVTDLERSRHFYGRLLGLVEITRPPFDFAGAWYLLGDRQLHLIVNPSAATLRGSNALDSRDGHCAFRVRSYRETLDHLRTHGIACRERPQNPTPWPQIYVVDPDGNVVELNAERLD
jgi:catechol 2,3-dioxygenase-like lactoylglutathione lyase family enzyme